MRPFLTAFFRQFASEQLLGAIDYFRYPDWRTSWGGAFNGQQRRVDLFFEIIRAIKPVYIVETGTYHGTTTELFLSTGIRTYTIEMSKRNYGFCKARFLYRKRVRVLNSDSRNGLRQILHQLIKNRIDETLFFYLDAHWNEDLPLSEEIDIVFSHCSDPVVMVDDFAVPGESGYGFDNYGMGKALDAHYISSMENKHQLRLFYPNTPAIAETGARRGCVLICRKGGRHEAALTNVPLLAMAKQSYAVSPPR